MFCACCGQPARNAGGVLQIVGHGCYSRQVCGVSECLWIPIWVRRFLCTVCGHTMSLLPDWLHPYRWYAATVIIEALCRHAICRESSSSIGERVGRPRDTTAWRSLFRWRRQLLISPSLWGWLGPRLGIRKPAADRSESASHLRRLLADGGHPFHSTLDLVQAVPAAVRRTLRDLVFSRSRTGPFGQFPAGGAAGPSPGRSCPASPTEEDSGRGPPRRRFWSASSNPNQEEPMNDDDRTREALFRHSILGELLSRELRRGELCRMLDDLSGKTFEDHRGRPRRIAHKTLEEWLYRYRHGGFEALKPVPRSDLGNSRVLAPELEQLIVDLKREDPGRSCPLIVRELELAGRIRRDQIDVSTVQRLLRRRGLSGPKLELDRPARYRWQASMCGELWQGDALHGPVLVNPVTRRPQRAIIFGLIDDRSRIVPYLEAGFGETGHRFLGVLYNAIARRGIPRALLLDNHASFTGYDLRVLCATLNTRLIFCRPGDGPAKGKVERFWRTLREGLLDRIDVRQVTTLDELNLRLWSYVEGEYHTHGHSSLSGRAPLEVWEDGAGDVRWVSDPAALETAFHAHVERKARNDSTILWRGVSYEVPTYLRSRTVRIRYSLLDPGRISVLDAPPRSPCVPSTRSPTPTGRETSVHPQHPTRNRRPD